MIMVLKFSSILSNNMRFLIVLYRINVINNLFLSKFCTRLVNLLIYSIGTVGAIKMNFPNSGILKGNDSYFTGPQRKYGRTKTNTWYGNYKDKSKSVTGQRNLKTNELARPVYDYLMKNIYRI